MADADVKRQVDDAIETLEALYFFTQGIKGKIAEHLDQVRQLYGFLLETGYPKFLAELKGDITMLREHFGALAPDEFFRGMLREAREGEGKGLVYIGKLRIVSDLFSKYENSVVRWPHIKLHAFVIYDPKVGFLNQMFEMDGQLFHDAQFLLAKARMLHAGANVQRDLSPNRHRILHTLLRPVVTALFTFVEAYLNGLAFDCFQKHHDELELDDHDFLGEWNSAQKRRRFVAFDQKVFKYPPLIAKIEGRKIDFSGFKPAHRIAQDGKEVRDAITHPSAQFDPDIREQKKVTLMAGLTLPELESLYTDICEYVRCVEEGLGHDANESAPWLFDDYGFKLAKSETI